jgi:hypothetical protein
MADQLPRSDFGPKYKLKNLRVSPNFVPLFANLGYDNLAIGDGETASLL